MQVPKPTSKKSKKKHAASIMQSEKCCFVTRSTQNLEEHHIFGGANRKNSEQYGLKVWLIREWHNEPPKGVHHNPGFMQHLHEKGQKAFEEKHGTRADFIRIFGKNYLDDDPAWLFDRRIK